MAVLKCNICGGELELSTDMSIGVCQYCDSTITIPKNLDHKGNLYNRAVFLRQNNEFDKAALIYEDILKEDNTDAEAHWGLVLSKYGIEYVADPVTGEHLPTCHRTQAESILSDPDYLAAIDYYDAQSVSVIEEQAKQINKIQSKILEISRREPPYDLFICYKETDEVGGRTEDSIIAQDLYYELIKRGYKVFFARKTLESKLGSEYEPIIYAALNSARVMIVLGTDPAHFNAVWVRNEWSRFIKMARDSKEEKIIIPAFKGISPYELPNELSNFQSQDMSKIGFMQDLTDGIERCLRNKTDKDDEKPVSGGVDMHQRLIKNGETHLRLQNFDAAESIYSAVVNDYPDDYRGWLGLIKCKTKGFTDTNCDAEKINVWYRYVCQLATPEDIAEIEKDYMDYLKKVSVAEVNIETENIVKIVAKHRETIVENEKTINSLNNALKSFKEGYYNTQEKIDRDNVTKASKGLKLYKSKLLRKRIFLSAFAVMFLSGIFGIILGILVDSYGYYDEAGFLLIGSVCIWVLSFLNLIIAPKGRSKTFRNQIEHYEKFLDESYSCQDNNKNLYEDTLKDYDNRIKKLKENTNLTRMKIAACNNYLNVGNEKIADFCFALKCATFCKNVTYDETTKELRDLAYGFKELVINTPEVNKPVDDVSTEKEEIVSEETAPTQQYEFICPYCGTQIVIDGGEYNRGYSFCGECGAKVEFKK